MYLYRHIDTFSMKNVSMYQYIFGRRYFFPYFWLYNISKFAIFSTLFAQIRCDFGVFYQEKLDYSILQRDIQNIILFNKNFRCIFCSKISQNVSVSAHRYIFWYCICIGTDTFCEKVSVSAHRYILNVSTKGLHKR